MMNKNTTPSPSAAAPCLVVSDENGSIFEIPELAMAAATVGPFVVPSEPDLIPLPSESTLYVLPQRIAAGYDPVTKSFVNVQEYRGTRVFPVAAFLPPGYLRTLHSAYHDTRGAPRLPLYCYAAVGWKRGRFYAATLCIDRQKRHAISSDLLKQVDSQSSLLLGLYPKNRLVRHLVCNCVTKYRCANACNLVLGRWECPIPVSRACNAACLGCISSQPAGSEFPSSQHRLDFLPTAGEIVEYVVPHLATAPKPIASFGQGCEGEPLLEAALIEKVIREIRAQTLRGSININTNASLPAEVERLCKASLNSMRVSLNSAQESFYNLYYRPKHYSFDSVRDSIKIAKRYNVFVSLNYLVFPGFTDNPSEVKALGALIRSTGIDMIQTRNLNIDPLWYTQQMSLLELRGKPMGMVRWVAAIKQKFPSVILGYFNPVSLCRGKRT